VKPLSVHLLVSLVACGTLAAGAGRAAPVLAVLPAEGSAPPDVRSGLDRAVREAAGAVPEFVLQSVPETADHLATMEDFGAACTFDDVPCFVKLGILATAEFVLVSRARGSRTLEVELVLVDVERGTVVRTVEGAVAASEPSAVSPLVQRALGQSPGAGGDDDDDPPRRPGLKIDRDPALSPDVKDPAAAGEAVPLGLIVAGVGGGVFAVGLLGALTSEAVFWTGTGPAEIRKNVVAPMGGVFWVVSALGLLTAGVGGVLALTQGPPGDDG
jgi:hypothetical protein